MATPRHSIPNRRELERDYQARAGMYGRVLEALQSRLTDDLRSIGLHPTVKARVKTFDSCYQKMLGLLAKGKSRQEAGLIYDVLGLRVVCPFLDDVKTVEHHIRSRFEVMEVEYKGSDHSFREFGYQSTHFLIEVPEVVLNGCAAAGPLACEIQVRTILQDAWSEVEHELIYKSDFSPFDEPMKRRLAALNANLTLSDTLFQEIRDYQRRLQAELQKRRRSFLAKVQQQGSAAVRAADSAGAEGVAGTGAAMMRGDRSVDDLLVEALEAHNAGRFRDAIAVYSFILQREFPGHIQSIIHIHRGMAYFAESEYGQALQDFNAALERDAGNHRALYYRGLTHQITGEHQAALQDFSDCLERNPYQFEPLYRRAQLYCGMGKIREAAADCASALKINPESPEALQLKQTLARGRRGRPASKD